MKHLYLLGLLALSACGTSSSDSGSTTGGAPSTGGGGAAGGTHSAGSGGTSAKGGSAGAAGGEADAVGESGAAGQNTAGGQAGIAGQAGEGGAADSAGGAIGAAGEAGAQNEAGAGGAPDAGCHDLTLLSGGTDVAAQGWQIAMEGPATLSYGAGFVQLATTTVSGAVTGGILLLYYPNAVEPGKPFRIRVELSVQAVNPHNQFDSGAALLASFTLPFGASKDRQEMVYLDPSTIGWADNSNASPTTTTASFPAADGDYHTYDLSLDASGTLSVSADGMPELSRAALTTNGTFAIGDQTNDAKVDGTMRIRSITKLCP